MRRILEFKAFESLNGLTKIQKKWLDRCTTGSWSVGADGRVNVEGSFDCSNQKLGGFKGVKFGRVSGSFYCHRNSLTTLEGAPQSVGEGFYCANNKLASLDGSPDTVGVDFYCYENQLESLKGASQFVGRNFYCYKNSLKTLEGAPETIGGVFYTNWISIRQWGLSGWLEVLINGEPKAQKLIATLISPEAINKGLKESPEKTMVALKGVWNSPAFAKIRSQIEIPEGYEDEMDLLVDLDDIGL
jgi:hypothetical protein